MAIFKPYVLCATLFAPLALAQQWEVGGLGGFGITPDVTVKNGTTSGSTGIKPGFLIGAYGGSNDYSRLGGEASYIFRRSDLRLSGGGKEVTMSGYTQFLDFRLVFHFAPRESRFRPFAAVGGGVAIYSGSGPESASQPLNNLLALTHTRETKPMVSGAFGVKYRITQHVGLRFEVRDFATPFPNRLLAPVPGATVSGWMNNIIPMGGIAGVF